VVLGAGLARRLTGGTTTRDPRRHRIGLYVRRAVAGLATAGLVALGALIAQPASTPPILGADGHRLPGSVAELRTLRLGGRSQAVMIRGYSMDNPVLLYLSGGPGGSDLPWSRAIMTELQRNFILVGWDQPGSAKSYPALAPSSGLTIDQEVADTVELTNYLRRRFDEPKIYLLGESWGSVLGVLTVQRHPDLFHAYIGVGQMVNPRETDRRLYRDMLSYAARTHDTALAAQLRSYGEPPYGNVWAYGVQLSMYDKIEPNYEPEVTNPEARSSG
jgi:pimeloyl-ACP methyl ester carboxylesterase